MEAFIQDLRFSFRMLTKNPGFTVVAIIALALGIGANTAIFSVVNSVLISPLPFKEPERLVQVWPQKYNTNASKAEFVEVRNNIQSVEDLAAYSGWSFTLTGLDEPLEVSGARATASFFSLLGVDAAIGRTFAPDEDQPGHDHVIILSHGFWQRRFSSDPNIVGQKVTLDGESHTIIGVMPPSFNFPSGERDMWVPAPINPNDENGYTAGYLNLLARLKPEVTIEQAQAEVSSIAQNAREKFPRSPNDYGTQAAVRSLRNEIVGDFGLTAFVLLGAVGFILLIACANVANLQLARMTNRQKEIAIRSALGARRSRVIRQLLTESVLLSLVGGAAGLLVALWGTSFLIGTLPEDTPRLAEITIDRGVLLFSAALSIAAGAIFGLMPAIQASKPDLNSALKEGGNRATAGGRLRSALVVTEVALVLMLLIGAGLLIKSFWRLQQVDPGFRPERVLSAQLAPPGTKYEEDSRKRAFYHEVISRIASLPGIESVGAIHLLPMGKSNWNPGLRVEDHPLPEGSQLPNVDWRVITPDYFRAMGIPLLKGRFFTESDNAENAPRVTIINEVIANRYWPDHDPIGKRIRSGFEGRNWVTIVGVVKGVKHHGLASETRLEMYRPYDQNPFPTSMTVMARTTGDPEALAASIANAVWSIDGEVPVSNIQPMTEVVSKSLTPQRSTMLLLMLFAGVAMVLGAVGIYGVISYTVSQRTREIGIRCALGAQAGDVMRLVVGKGLKLTLTGVAIGIVGAIALTQVMESLLFNVSATDPATFVAVSGILVLVALGACAVPARRALKVDPMTALRYE
ncbi:MAG: ABC transporter permease [Acidobacteriota bacterium]